MAYFLCGGVSSVPVCRLSRSSFTPVNRGAGSVRSPRGASLPQKKYFHFSEVPYIFGQYFKINIIVIILILYVRYHFLVSGAWF